MPTTALINILLHIFQQYAVDCEAEVVGKPAQGFFMSALKDMGVKPENVSFHYGVLH